MKTFKFLSNKRIPLYTSVFVDYTTDFNGKSFTSLRFAERDQVNNNPNIKIYQGTFLGFKNMIHNDYRMDWLHNKPVSHLMAFYSKRFSNCQRLGYIDYFRTQGRHRFGKNQKLRIYYEVI